MEAKMPKVFISYSWSSVDYKDRIRHYAERLRENHVDVLLDIWDLSAGQDKNAYMEKMVTDPSVTHVLVFIDKRYTEKANARKDGVGTESQIISQRLYSSVDQSKFIPIFCEKDESGKLSAPAFFESRIGFDFSTPAAENDNWEPLLRFLFGKPEYTKPALGPLPAFLDEKNAPIALPTNKSFRLIQEKSRQQTSGYLSLNNMYLSDAFRFLDSLRVRTMPPQDQIETYDEVVYNKLQQLIPFRNQFIEWVELQVLSLDDNKLCETLKGLIPRFAEIKGRAPELSSWRTGIGLFDIPALLIHEIILYTVALLLKHKRDRVIRDITFSRYYMYDGDNMHKKDFNTIGILWSRAESYSRRNQRLQLNRMDLFADWIKEHAENRFADFEQLMEADGVLCLASLLKQDAEKWYPRTFVYAEWGNLQLELFDAARDIDYAKRLLTIFGESDLESLKGKLRALTENHQRYFGDVMFYMLRTINYDLWGTLK
ncbi:MAG: toll/interleukin-1 receptor domain-containing protein [Kiritimatiellae bacterium]|nr:toll/interleukin-1 receptor domain-containing protein [Kiritimatiellia bacterium]